MSSNTAIIRFSCPICSVQVKKKNVTAHLKLHVGNSRCGVESCEFTNDDPDLFLHHLYGHLKKRFECPTCGDIYTTAASYREHCRLHGDALYVRNVFYACVECGQTFHPGPNAQACMRAHQEVHGRSGDADALSFSDDEEQVEDNENKYSLENESEFIHNDVNNMESYGLGQESKDIDTGLSNISYQNLSAFGVTENIKPEEATEDIKSESIEDNDSRMGSVEKDEVETESNSSLKVKDNFDEDHVDEKPLRRKSGRTPKQAIQRKGRVKTLSKKTGKLHTCEMCDVGFKSKKELNAHHKIAHERKTPYICAHCSRAFKTSQTLKVHLGKFHQEINNKPVDKSVVEDGCDFTEQGNNNQSQEPDEGVEGQKTKDKSSERVVYECEECDKVFKSRQSYQNHNKSHHSDAFTQLCSLCGATFKTSHQYRYHMKQHDATFECTTCHKFFPSIKKLKGHMNRKGCHLCEVCGRTFKQRYNLVLHRSVHTGEKPFQCYQCGKMFRTKYYLEDHLRVHLGEKRFACKECDWKFITVGALRRHSRTHSGERPFMCSECGKSFALHPNLNRHMRIHNGDKYSCPLCDRKITEKSNLAKHMKVHEKRGETMLNSSSGKMHSGSWGAEEPSGETDPGVAPEPSGQLWSIQIDPTKCQLNEGTTLLNA